MATIAGGLNIAILKRLRGTEVLTGDFLAAQAVTSALTWRWGTMARAGSFPHGNFYDDASVDASPREPDRGILQHSIRRFELWTQDTESAFFNDLSNALEKLFDERRGAPEITLTGDGRVYECALFSGFQGPFHADAINAWYGLMAFRFVESRPY